MAMTELARNPAMRSSALGYAVERGEGIAPDNRYQLINY
jgi:hypothetical protein